MVTTRLQSGCVTFWTIADYSDIASLRAGWEAIGLGQFVPEQRPNISCLKDAMTEVLANNHVLVRPLQSRTGFVAVKEQRGTDDNSYAAVLSARFNGDESTPTFSVMNEDAEKVLEAYRNYSGRDSPTPRSAPPWSRFSTA
jgi:hypothetical protein